MSTETVTICDRCEKEERGNIDFWLKEVFITSEKVIVSSPREWKWNHLCHECSVLLTKVLDEFDT